MNSPFSQVIINLTNQCADDLVISFVNFPYFHGSIQMRYYEVGDGIGLPKSRILRHHTPLETSKRKPSSMSLQQKTLLWKVWLFIIAQFWQERRRLQSQWKPSRTISVWFVISVDHIHLPSGTWKKAPVASVTWKFRQWKKKAHMMSKMFDHIWTCGSRKKRLRPL